MPNHCALDAEAQLRAIFALLTDTEEPVGKRFIAIYETFSDTKNNGSKVLGVHRTTYSRQAEGARALCARHLEEAAKAVVQKPTPPRAKTDRGRAETDTPPCKNRQSGGSRPDARVLRPRFNVNSVVDVVSTEHETPGERATTAASHHDPPVRFVRTSPGGTYHGYLGYLRADWQAQCDEAGKRIPFTQTTRHAVEGLTEVFSTYDWETIRECHRYTCLQAAQGNIPITHYTRMFVGGGFNARLTAQQQPRAEQTELNLEDLNSPEMLRVMALYQETAE